MTPPVSLVIVNARVWTGSSRRPWADAVAVRGDRIAAVGSSAELRKHAGRTARVVDARRGMLVPGFIDAHVHLVEGGLRLASVRLRGARTPAQFGERLAAFAAGIAPGTWITGGDWDHTRWGGALPHRDWIDPVTPRHPVLVHRLDGHTALANTLALQRAGVDAGTPDVAGGEIVRDASGAPTGILRDAAIGLVTRAIPEPTPEQADRALDEAMRHLAAQGVTSVHGVGSLARGGWWDLAILDRAHASGRLRTRVYAAVPLATWERLRDRVAERGRGDEWLRVGALKGFADGSLGSRTAAMLAPYDDAPGQRGLLVAEPEELYRQIAGADRAGLHVLVHAIGDRANRLLLDLYERVRREHGPRDRRFRVEHAQHLAPGDIARFAPLGVIPSMQPYHAADDGRWAERAIGAERSRTAFAFRSLAESGARLAFGSDWFVAPPVPVAGIHAAVTRRPLDGSRPEGWGPEQAIDVQAALRAYTSGAAYAGFEEEEKGTIAPGKLADLVLLDRDLTTVSVDALRDARVMLTVVGGEVVFERAEPAAS